MYRSFRASAVLIVVGCAVAGPFAARGAEVVSEAAVRRARSFLESRFAGRSISEVLHFTSPYQHRLVDEQTMVRGVARDGHLVPDEFALVYTFVWGPNADGETEISFVCDAAGDIRKLEVLQTNAGLLNQPFAQATAAMKFTEHIVLGLLDDQLTPSQRAAMQELVKSGNAQDLLLEGIRIAQSLQPSSNSP